MSKPTVVLVVGVAIGVLLHRVLSEPSSCCRRVSSGVRDRATGAAGSWIGPVGDALGLWRAAPGLLDLFGV